MAVGRRQRRHILAAIPLLLLVWLSAQQMALSHALSHLQSNSVSWQNAPRLKSTDQQSSDQKTYNQQSVGQQSTEQQSTDQQSTAQKAFEQKFIEQKSSQNVPIADKFCQECVVFSPLLVFAPTQGFDWSTRLTQLIAYAADGFPTYYYQRRAYYQSRGPPTFL